MANDHYAICYDKQRYCYLGEFYEGDVDSQMSIEKRMNDEVHSERLDNGTGVMFMLRLCAFMRRHRPYGVRIVQENEFWDIQELEKELTWIEDEL
jgi:hypothetical protein